MLEKKNEEAITEAEAALYDRQIRLWGLDAQRRLRAAKVLLIGLGGLGAETAKNIILSGVKAVTLLDHTDVSEEDRCSQFLLDHGDTGKNRAQSSQKRAQELNPMVEVTADSGDVADKQEDYFTKYDVVVVTSCGREQLLRISNICRSNSIMFYCGDVFGFYGYMFADLGEHDYAQEVPVVAQNKEPDGSGEPVAKKTKTEEQETTTVKKSIKFGSLDDALNVDWTKPEKLKALKRTPSTYFILQILLEHYEQYGMFPSTTNCEKDLPRLRELRETVMQKLNVSLDIVPEDFGSYCFAELSPVSAVVGGVLGQEIIKAVSQKDTPHNNFFFFNGIEGSGMVDCISK